MNYSDLASFYSTEFSLKFDHHYSLEEQGAMIPFERDLHVQRIVARLKELKQIQES